MKDNRRKNAEEYEKKVYDFISQLVVDGEMPGATKHAKVLFTQDLLRPIQCFHKS